MSEIEPQLQRREAQPYLAIHEHVTSEAEFRRAADRGFPALFGWLGEHGADLAAAHATLQAWMDAQGLARAGHVEHYLSGPNEEPDFTRWQTELAYLTTA